MDSNEGAEVRDKGLAYLQSAVGNQQSLATGHLPPATTAFRLLVDPPAAGDWNMAVDETLLESAAADGQCTVRFYQWQEPTLSLGYFQTYADRWRHAASRQAAVVRRASGGGAIVHDRELTYSIAVPARHPLAVGRLEFYRAIHRALIATLAQWGMEAEMWTAPPGDGRIDAPDRPAGRQPFLCFQRRSPGDVLVGGVKIAGSAQRRCQSAVLQHGSVLLARSAAAPELDGLWEMAGKEIAPRQLAAAWLARLADACSFHWQNGGLSESQLRRVTALVCEKHAQKGWIENRTCTKSFDEPKKS